MLGELLCQNRYMKYLTKLKSILYSKPNHLVEHININGVLMVAGCNSFGGRRGTCTKNLTLPMPNWMFQNYFIVCRGWYNFILFSVL